MSGKLNHQTATVVGALTQAIRGLVRAGELKEDLKSILDEVIEKITPIRDGEKALTVAKFKSNLGPSKKAEKEAAKASAREARALEKAQKEAEKAEERLAKEQAKELKKQERLAAKLSKKLEVPVEEPQETPEEAPELANF